MQKIQINERKTASVKESRQRREDSPYSKNFKCYVKSDQRDLIYKRQMVTKLSRTDLEDKYIVLCDENFFLKRRFNESEEKVKNLTARIVRLTETHRCYSTSAILKENRSENNLSMYRKPNNSMVRASSLNMVFKKPSTPTDNAGSGSNTAKSKSSSSETKRSSSSTGTSSSSDQEKGQSEKSEKEFVKQLDELKKENDTLSKDLAMERERIEKIVEEKSQVEDQLSKIDLKKFLVENMEVNRLKRKLEHFQNTVRKMQEQNQKILKKIKTKLEEERKKNYEFTLRLKDEYRFNSELIEKENELKSAIRNIEMLKKQISELEFDKKSLIEQQESLSNLLKDAVSQQKDPISSTVIEYDSLKEAIEQLKTEKAAIENSKNEMFSKICQLQDRYDQLQVDLEGIKAERSIQDGIETYSIENSLLSIPFVAETTNVE